MPDFMYTGALRQPSIAPTNFAVVQSEPAALADLQRDRQINDLRLKSKFENIFAKYSKDFSEVGDIIDLASGRVVEDNGHVSRMADEGDAWGTKEGDAEDEAGAAYDEVSDGEEYTGSDIGGLQELEDDWDELADPRPKTSKRLGEPGGTLKPQTPSRRAPFNSQSAIVEQSPNRREPTTVISPPATAAVELHASRTTKPLETRTSFAPTTPIPSIPDIEALEKLGQSIAQNISQFLDVFNTAKNAARTTADSTWAVPALPALAKAQNSNLVQHALISSARCSSPPRGSTPFAPSVWALETISAPGQQRRRRRTKAELQLDGMRGSSRGKYTANTTRLRRGQLTTAEEDVRIKDLHENIGMSFADIQKMHLPHLTKEQIYRRYYYRLKGIQSGEDQTETENGLEFGAKAASEEHESIPTAVEGVSSPRKPSAVNRSPETRSKKRRRVQEYDNQWLDEETVDFESLLQAFRPRSSRQSRPLPTDVIPNSSSIEDPFSQPSVEQAPLSTTREPLEDTQVAGRVKNVEHQISSPADRGVENSTEGEATIEDNQKEDEGDDENLSVPALILESIEFDPPIKREVSPSVPPPQTPSNIQASSNRKRASASPDHLSGMKSTRFRSAKPATMSTGSRKRPRGLLISEMDSSPRLTPSQQRRALNKKRSSLLLSSSLEQGDESSGDELAF